ncbi:outer membrane beta-barrel family protein [Winogradskyella sp.]|jgi:outer membrane receptor protein involved in Fe transport|uniref:outer membrane beta-barrel family protein n=1 Tax=Winogradskyella sp. TaxID=1883156 RepID=UPI0025CBE651|nr:outer membrane beta-barrel family protein [Winogradskyella sp.]MCT4628607.1 TonB-dependent receptor family protein [Winogradskyella sp.]
MKQFIMMLILVSTTILSAQPNANKDIKNGSVSGRVIDAKLNEPLPYVNIVVKDQNNKVITGGITNESGDFKIEQIPEGNITVSIQFIGYKTINEPVKLGKGNYKVNLGDIKLEEESTGLDEVTIVADVSTIQQKVDRKVINIGKDLQTAGATASEIMNNLPSVNVDQQSGAISMRGNQNVRVMVDGKLSNIPADQLLKQIPSTSIKSVELITNPSAKYNPEGMSGIINIVLHKNTMIGFNGNINFSLAHDIEPKFNSSIDANYRNGKFNLYGSYSNGIIKNYNNGRINRIEQQITQSFNVLDNNKSHLFKIGLDYYLDDKNTISVFTNQNIFDNWVRVNTNIDYLIDPSSDESQNTYGENENDSQQYNFNYKHDFDEGHNIELEVDHNIFEGLQDTNNNFFNSQRPNFNEATNTDRTRTTINLDYVNPLSESVKLELGLQARLFENSIFYESNAREQNESGTYIPTTTRFDYTRDIYSAYATYGKKLEKWSYQIGLRAENVNVNSEAFRRDLAANTDLSIPFKNDYFELYPSAFFTYTPSDKNSYQLSYSRRIDRPGIGQVNPLPEWNTALISQFGNQELLPQFTNSMEVNYTRQLKKGSVTAGVFYRIIEDEIQQAVLIDRADTNRLILTNLNFDNTSSYGIELSSNYSPTKWWSINGSFDLFSQKQKSIAESFDTNGDIVLNTVEVDNVVWNLRAFNNFKVNKSLSFSAFGMYRGKNKNIQFEMKDMYTVNLGMRYNFMEGRASFSLNYNDIFNTMYARFDGQRPFLQRGQFNWESQQISGRLSYRFGGGKYRAKSRKRRDNDEKQGGGGFF